MERPRFTLGAFSCYPFISLNHGHLAMPDDEQIPAPLPPPICQVCKRRHEPGTAHPTAPPPGDTPNPE